jgi:hypothetical protein
VPDGKLSFTHFRELLEEREQRTSSYSSLSVLLKGAGIVSPKTRRSAGELVQTDASLFDRLGQGLHYALHGFQDDVTGNILGLYLCEHECLRRLPSGYFEAFRAVLQGNGAPQALYADYISSTPKTGTLVN